MSKNSYRKSVVLSVVSMVLSVAMLIGVTYANFTSTAQTGVNEIIAGTLDIALLDAAGNSLEGEGKSVGFVVPEGKTGLWEPGISYELQPVTIKNEGNLDLKYKIEINGLNSGVEGAFDSRFTWSVKVNGVSTTLSDYEGHLQPADPQGTNHASDTLVLVGTMIDGEDEIDNEYMDERLAGVTIRVLATQNLESASYPS